MTSDLDIHDLARHVAVMEKSMETLKAEQEGALDRLRADMANWKTDMANWKTDMANWKTDMVKRDKDNQRWIVGLFIAAIVIIPVLSNSAAIANLVTLLGS